MIYFLDNSLQLQKIVTSKNTGDIMHHEELNGLIHGNVELDLSYANKFLILGIDHVGYYYKSEFYLHKIQRVEYDHVNESVKVVFRHIFFEDMLFGPIIKDVRPKNQDAVTILRQTIEANTRWQIVMTDVTGTLSTNFYWQVPYEVIEFVNKNFRVDMFPKILFDGKNINGFQLHVKNASSSEVKQRIPFGSRVLDLKYEEDFSEIVTKLVGHGKGEEVGDGYGKRINFSEINFNRNGVKSPVGSVYIEDPSVTNTYGNDGQTPREGRVVFEDIESPSELAEATYQHYLEVSRPQMLFTADVADIGDVSIGDSVLIVRREYDVYFKARIHKLSVNLLNPEDAQVELGDYEHFKESKVERKSREKNNRVQKQLSDRIARLKREANDFIDGEFSQALAEFEQNYIDQKAQVKADFVRMEDKIEGTRTEFTDNLNAEITQTKDYAEQQAQAKADEVRTDLGTVTSGHQQMLDDLESNVMNIDDFLGDSRSITLDERFHNISLDFEERIKNIDSTHYNMLRGSSLDNPDLYTLQNTVQLVTSELDNFARLGLGSSNIPFISLTERFQIVAGEQYHLVFSYRTEVVPEADYLELRGNDLSRRLYVHEELPPEEFELKTDGLWNKKVISFTAPITQSVQIFIGTNFSVNNTTRGVLDIKKPYLTTTNNREWLPHPDDDTQNVSEIVRRVTLLEDGRSELITRSEYDFETGQLDQYIKSVEESVEGNKTVLQRVEDWQTTNGASIEETIYGFDQKVWLNDVANIGANLIPQSANAWESGGLWIEGGGESGNIQNIRTKKRIEVQPNTTYTLSSNSLYVSAIERIDIHQYLNTGGWINRRTIPRNGEVSFTTWSNAETVRITLVALEGFSIPTNFIDHPGGRIKVKLEVGDKATPMLNAISRFEQLADKVAIQVQELDGDFLTQSDIQVQAGYVQLGSQRLGDEQLASIFRVSPNSIDAITERMTLNGSLYVDGDITALAVNAIEGNFARLFANQLTANVITSDHIQVGTALIDKFFATSARIDELITKTHFVNEMHALTLNVVDLNASQIRTRLLSANTIEADWIKSGTALLDRVFSSTAMFERMMAKSAFITTLSTVTLDLHELTIWRPDGVAFVMNGMERFGHPVPVVRYLDDEVETDDKTYWTNSRGAQVVGIAYGDHAGRYYNLVVGAGLRWDSDYAVQNCNIQVRTVNSPAGVNIPVFNREVTVHRSSGLQWFTLNVPLGRPTYGAMTFQIEIFRRGENVYAPVEMRYGRSWISA